MTALEIPPDPTGVEVLAEAELPTRFGHFRAIAFTAPGEEEHVALVHGDPGVADVLVRLHSECLTGDIVGSLRCDCGEQLDRALTMIVENGSGVLLYLRGHEGRGIGIAQKLRAYALQEQGLDTVSANVALGLPVDARDFRAPVAFLAALGVRTVRLLTNNPAKVAALEAGGVGCSSVVAMPSTVTPHNRRYLATKANDLGHLGLRAGSSS